MYSAFALLVLITGQLLLAASGVQGDRFFAVGERIDGDQLLLKDVQHSRPAGNGKPASVVFNYNIVEPITYIEIMSEENISADVQFSYSDSLVVGIVRLVEFNESYNIENLNEDYQLEDMAEELHTEFDVTIRIFGFNHTHMSFDPAQLLNRGTQYRGIMQPPKQPEIEEYTEGTDNEENEILQIDKIIEIGERQEGDDLIYEIAQTSSTTGVGNHSATFYYIDKNYITYIKFVVFDHFANKVNTTEYTPPVVEYSHFSPCTLKAVVTDFNVRSLFVQMFMYGYSGPGVAPTHYKAFLKSPLLQQPRSQPASSLNALQQMQLQLLMAGTTQSPVSDDDDDDNENDAIRPEDMRPDHSPAARSIGSAASVNNQAAIKQQVYALLGLMLFAIA